MFDDVNFRYGKNRIPADIFSRQHPTFCSPTITNLPKQTHPHGKKNGETKWESSVNFQIFLENFVFPHGSALYKYFSKFGYGVIFACWS